MGKTGTTGGTDDRQAKLRLLETSYREILDATKHQDDKIGRILTGIAFLTAAALAFANQGGIGITTRFLVSDRKLPLLAFAVGAYVVGVVLTVSLLLSSLTTGLTLPGSAPPTRRRPGDKSSLIYFYSIARIPKDEWKQRWEQTTPTNLQEELEADYIRETYNLAQRTNHKYTRTNEAVALFSLTFFALGVAFVLGTSVAVTSSRVGTMVPLTWQARLALAAFVATYTGVQVLAARRETRLRTWTRGMAVADRVLEEDQRREREFRAYQYAIPAVAAALVAPGRDAASRVAAAAVVIAAVVAVAVAVWRRPAGAARRVAAVAAVALVLAVVLTVREEVWRLLAAATVPALLTVRNFVEHWRRSGPPVAAPTEGDGTTA